MMFRILRNFVGARSESRTRTPVRAADFESAASTNSAIRARSGLRGKFVRFALKRLQGAV